METAKCKMRLLSFSNASENISKVPKCNIVTNQEKNLFYR